MIEEYMKFTLSTRALIGVLFIIAALVGTPLAIYQLQQQQEIRQRADTTLAWATNQTASAVCPTSGTGVNINVSFTNTEPDRSSLSMDVIAKDRQTGKSVTLGSIRGGQTKSGVILTGKQSVNGGTVDFALKWSDGHYGTDSRSATYKSVSGCYPPAPTITAPKYPSPSVTYPSTTPPYSTPKPSTKPSLSPYPSTPYGPTPTICPSLGPVQNVRIDCPNCP